MKSLSKVQEKFVEYMLCDEAGVTDKGLGLRNKLYIAPTGTGRDNLVLYYVRDYFSNYCRKVRDQFGFCKVLVLVNGSESLYRLKEKFEAMNTGIRLSTVDEFRRDWTGNVVFALASEDSFYGKAAPFSLLLVEEVFDVPVQTYKNIFSKISRRQSPFPTVIGVACCDCEERKTYLRDLFDTFTLEVSVQDQICAKEVFDFLQFVDIYQDGRRFFSSGFCSWAEVYEKRDSVWVCVAGTEGYSDSEDSGRLLTVGSKESCFEAGYTFLKSHETIESYSHRENMVKKGPTEAQLKNIFSTEEYENVSVLHLNRYEVSCMIGHSINRSHVKKCSEYV